MRLLRRRRVSLIAMIVLALCTPLLALAAGEWKDKTSELRHAIKGGHAKNVIFLLGDDMGDSIITIACSVPSCVSDCIAATRRLDDVF